jgi:hypothetical protein
MSGRRFFYNDRLIKGACRLDKHLSLIQIPVNTPLEDKPNVGIRMLIWFGIYFGAQLPLIAYYPFITMFPAGLISAYISPFLPPTENDYFPVLR